MNEILRIENLTKSFGQKTVLNDFDLALGEGSVYGLLGKNGEGKTTLCRIILGVIPWDKGEVTYKGNRMGFNRPAYKKEVGFIPEESIFFGWMTIGELLSFNSAFYPRWSVQKADDLVRRFSLEKKLKIKNLSRGMKLKLGLILALASSPELLILDDPTSGLDVPTRHDFLKDIIQEILEAGTTILFSSHMVHELEGIIDHLGILHHGRLILQDNFEAAKNKAKKIRLIFDGSVPDNMELKGILTKRVNGKSCDLAVYPWDEEKRCKLEAFHPKRMEVESMTLEEIFIHFVS